VKEVVRAQDAVHETAEVVYSISRVVKWTCGITILTLIIVGGMVYVTYRHDRALDKLAVLASENFKKVVEVRARQDANDSIVVHYIQDTITAINKLQHDNADPKEIQKRGLKVPKAPELRPPNVPAPTNAISIDRLWSWYHRRQHQSR